MTDPNAFESANYYDCDDGSEELSYTCPEEAIESYLDARADVGDSMEKLIAEHAPVTVYAFSREKPHGSWYRATAISLAEDALERWCDDYGGELPDLEPKLETAFESLLREHFTPERVWSCKQVASREYGAEELRDMFKDEIAADEKAAGEGAKP